MPTSKSATEGGSKLTRANRLAFSSRNAENSTTTTASSATTTNSTRQPSESTMTPETEGPMAGAKLMMSPTTPMALPRFSRGKVSMMMVMTMGMTTPVAIACMTRPSNRKGKLGAAAHTPAASANHAMPPRNNLRVEKRPTKNAFMGMTTASTSIYPLVSHCTVVAETPKSSMIVGNAGERKVAFSTTRRVPASNTMTVSNCLRASPMKCPNLL